MGITSLHLSPVKTHLKTVGRASVSWVRIPPSPPILSVNQANLRLLRSDLDFRVDVTLHERDRRYMATADFAEDSRDVGVGGTAQEAVRAALPSLGEPYATEMATGVDDEAAP